MNIYTYITQKPNFSIHQSITSSLPKYFRSRCSFTLFLRSKKIRSSAEIQTVFLELPRLSEISQAFLIIVLICCNTTSSMIFADSINGSLLSPKPCIICRISVKCYSHSCNIRKQKIQILFL